MLYNPGLKTSDIMIPGLAGVVLVFVGTIITSLGVVRERQSGTLEQLAVMPLKPRDVFLGKIVPYFAVATLDLAIVVGVGVTLFGVPFRGSVAVFALGALLFLFVTLGLGILISSVSENQGQAIQLAFMVTLPQVLLSGLIFPLSSIAAGVRWISYLLPLTYFNEISRGVMLRAEPLTPLWQPFLFLALLGAIVFTLASLRFRAYLAPAAPRGGAGSPHSAPSPASATSAAAPRPPGAPGDRAAPATAPRTGGAPRTCASGTGAPWPSTTSRSAPNPAGSARSSAATERAAPRCCAAWPARSRPPAARSGCPPRWDRVPVRRFRDLPGPVGRREPGVPRHRLPAPAGRRPGSAAPNSSPGPGWTGRRTGWPGSSPAACGRSSA